MGHIEYPIRIKKRQEKFDDEFEETQSASKKDRTDGLYTDYSTSNGQQETDDGPSDEIFNDPKTPAVITLDSCDIKPTSFKYLPENQSTKKVPNNIV